MNDRYSIEKICTDMDAMMVDSPGYSIQKLLTSPVESEDSVSFGVDWSKKAESTSHCWLPYQFVSHSSAPTCGYTLCTISQPYHTEPFIQCGTCAISIHKEHIADLQNATGTHQCILPCRPSFNDDIVDKYDQHYWSRVPVLKQPCIICRRKNKRSSGLTCLWCSQNCHRQCWENLNDNDNDIKCDYGKYKNIIVRPQWLHRVSNSPSRFRARFSDDIDARNTSLTPLIVFINKLSGGQKGEKIYNQLVRLLNPRQVFVLQNDETIKQALDIYSSLRNTRILICGGDGSVGWILSSLADAFTALNNPPVSICPMGTGNDLSRVLEWGWFYSIKRLLSTLDEIPNAQPIALDRWQVDFEPLTPADPVEDRRLIHRCLSWLLDHPRFVIDTNPSSYEKYQRPLNVRFTNYISFGLDAAVVLDFHVKRMRDPTKFTSPLKNKLFYLNIGRQYFKEFALWKAWNLSSYMRLICDGRDLTDSLRHCHTVVLLNIPSYGAGTHPWSRTYAHTDPILTNDQDDNSSDYQHISNTDQMGIQSISDRKIEVLGLDSIQMALIHLGLRGRRIAQCNQVRIELTHSMPVHMDGDPFYLPKSTAVNVTHAGQVLVLKNEAEK